MKNLHPLIFSLLFFNNLIIAQETKPNTFKHALGAGAGFTTGYGLSYRFMPIKLGFQINFAPYKTETISRFSYGLTFLYTLITTEKTSLYVYQANHFYSNTNTQGYNPVNNLYDKKEEESYFNNGLGFGFEILIVKNVGLNLMTGYASYRNGKELNITGETAIYFKF
jgi:hypothetical protein